ncbi:hypothetical protein BT93_G0525 [Corymbia citriodora subsp. variegata]|nr:hypothetical protein BT93_G0525 [Corymbia citriodora subsp. variegata]
MAVPMHIHRYGVWGGIEVQTPHHKIFERVPGSFPKAQVKKSPQTMALIFQDKSWPLKLISHEHYGKLSACSATFMRETSLKVEDVCAFSSFIERDEILFRVSIFRTTDKTWVNNNTV